MSKVPLNIDFQQILLHLLNFVILFAIIYFLLYKPVKKFMEKRRQEYEDMDAQAERKLSEASQMKESYEEKLKGADEEIRSKMTQAAQDSQKRCEDMEEEARLKARQIVDNAVKEAEDERDKIIDQAGESVVRIAQDAARKVIFENSSDAFDQFLNEAEQEKE